MQQAQLALAQLKAVLAWIDTIPKDAALPAMPGFDRDAVDALISGHPDTVSQLTVAQALDYALEWVAAVPDRIRESAPALTTVGCLSLVPADSQADSGVADQALRQQRVRMLEWIDTVPQDAMLHAMPGFDRDSVDSLLLGQEQAHPAITMEQAHGFAMDWITAVPDGIRASLAPIVP